MAMVHKNGMTNKHLLGLMACGTIAPVLVLVGLCQQGTRVGLFHVIALAGSYVLGCSVLVASNRALERRLRKPDQCSREKGEEQ